MIKNSFTNLLKTALRRLSLRLLNRFNPDVIAITGSVGKTSAKEAIYTVLKSRFNVQRNIGNYNNEIGVPATILGWKAGKINWIKNFSFGLIKLFFTRKYWEKLILEMGADHPGDIKYLTSFVKPKISVVTKVAASHLEFFGSLENIAKEKGALVEALDQNGWAVLNYDDDLVRSMSKRAKSNILFFGLDKKADIYASDIKTGLGGTYFRVYYKNQIQNIHLDAVGKHYIYAVLAATACGVIYGMKLREIAEALESFQPPKDRTNIFEGIKKTIVINDVYNANPESMLAAIDVLNDIYREKKTRRIAILADMLELGEKSKEIHYDLGIKIKDRIDVLFTYGDLAKNINTGKAKLKSYHFDDKKGLVKKLHEIIKEGDIILVKGSRGMHMETIVDSLRP